LSEPGDREGEVTPRVVGRSGRRKGSAVTIHEVARHANVSPMTVSRVINGESNVRDTTRETVMEAVRALNYRPNTAARVLAGARDIRIALIYSNPSASYLSEMLVGALDGSHRAAAQLVLDRWDNLKPAAEKAAAQKLSEGITGVILPPPLCESKAIAAAFAAEGVPAVAMGTGRAREDVSCVRIDDFHAAREMTLHLINLGHTRIAFIKGQPTQTASGQRQAGFEAAMQESGIEVDPALVVQGFFSYKSGLEAAEKLLGRKGIPTAIFASNDDMAAAAISVAHRRALDVPNDLSVVGFDDTPIATTVWPELTTIRQPIAAMAEAAINLLLHKIRRPKDRHANQPVDHLVPYLLVKRDSVAPPRKA
jgi:LacI family transcriptional regulator